TLIWIKPPGYKKDLQKGDSGKAVEWLARQLDHIQGSMIPPGQSHTMDAILEDRLKSFQKSEDIPADGIAGVLTLMRINERIGLDSPRLQTVATN
ncbi:MAG: peptidoglycan-binding protein, partial [Mariprofundus sp.]|nr:peptidoglycan-binding protein [Mariprofundus sp.]